MGSILHQQEDKLQYNQYSLLSESVIILYIGIQQILDLPCVSSLIRVKPFFSRGFQTFLKTGPFQFPKTEKYKCSDYCLMLSLPLQMSLILFWGKESILKSMFVAQNFFRNFFWREKTQLSRSRVNVFFLGFSHGNRKGFYLKNIFDLPMVSAIFVYHFVQLGFFSGIPRQNFLVPEVKNCWLDVFWG